VIRAFNENLPGTVHHLATRRRSAARTHPGPGPGHRLQPTPPPDQRGRQHRGGVPHEYVADRVHTMGTAFLGLTLECARCHDHKYDPVSSATTTAFRGFFNSIDESGLYSHFTRATPLRCCCSGKVTPRPSTPPPSKPSVRPNGLATERTAAAAAAAEVHLPNVCPRPSPPSQAHRPPRLRTDYQPTHVRRRLHQPRLAQDNPSSHPGRSGRPCSSAATTPPP
jgi:hypothetical protein